MISPSIPRLFVSDFLGSHQGSPLIGAFDLATAVPEEPRDEHDDTNPHHEPPPGKPYALGWNLAMREES